MRKQGREHLNLFGLRIVGEATGEPPRAVPPHERKSTTGRAGGPKGGAASAEKLTAPLSSKEMGELYVDKASAVPGVLKVESITDSADVGTSVHVYIQKGNLAAEYAIYDLQASVTRQFPSQSIEVTVFERND